MISYAMISFSGPNAVAIGDLNGVNHLDIAIANFDSSTVSVILGDGNGTLQTQLAYSTGNHSEPLAIALGDFNNDTRLDIVVVNSNTFNIGIFIGNGNGTFQAQNTIATGSYSYPNDVAVGNINNDGRLDIVVANSGTNRIVVFLGSGNGTFKAQKLLSAGSGSVPYSVGIGDFSEDNISDIVVVNYGTNKVGIFIGYGNGSFRAQTTFSSGNLPITVDVADFNGDSHLDIVVVNSGDNSVSIFLGDGNATFRTQMVYSTGFNTVPYSVAIADFNKDKSLDMVVSNVNDSSIDIFLGNGDGSFGVQTTFSTGINSEPYTIAVGDINEDNRPDVVSTNYGSNTLGIFLNTC